MNKMVNRFLLAGEKFMPEMNLRQHTALDKSGFTYSACGPFTKDRYVCSGCGLDSIRVQNFHYLTVEWVKMLLFLELI